MPELITAIRDLIVYVEELLSLARSDISIISWL